MSAGGVDKLQPGIESLSTPILRLMAKGTSRLQNIQLLKWCEEFKIILKWNILCGFPGEPEEEYTEMAALMPLLVHLCPPSGLAKFRLDRFSPYWQSPESYGIQNMRRFWAYDFAYSGLDVKQRERVAYFFEYDYEDQRDPFTYARQIVDAANYWLKAYKQKITLEIKVSDGNYYVLDTRDCINEKVYPLTSKALRLLMELDSSRSCSKALAAVNRKSSEKEQISEQECNVLSNQFLERKWVIKENSKLLSLVLDRSGRKRVIKRRVASLLEQVGLSLPADIAEVVNCPGMDSNLNSDENK